MTSARVSYSTDFSYATDAAVYHRLTYVIIYMVTETPESRIPVPSSEFRVGHYLRIWPSMAKLR